MSVCMRSTWKWAWYVVTATLSVGCSSDLQIVMSPVAWESERRSSVMMARDGFSARAKDDAFIIFALPVVVTP